MVKKKYSPCQRWEYHALATACRETIPEHTGALEVTGGSRHSSREEVSRLQICIQSSWKIVLCYSSSPLHTLQY